MTIFEHTVRLNKETRGKSLKKKSPRAIKAIRKVATKLSGVKDVRLDPSMNELVWSQGIRNPPRRVRIEVKVYEQDNQKIAYVSPKSVDGFKGLKTVKIDE